MTKYNNGGSVYTNDTNDDDEKRTAYSINETNDFKKINYLNQ